MTNDHSPACGSSTDNTRDVGRTMDVQPSPLERLLSQNSVLKAQENFKAVTMRELDALIETSVARPVAVRTLLNRISPGFVSPNPEDVQRVCKQYQLAEDDGVRAIVVKAELTKLKRAGLNTLAAIEMLTRRISIPSSSSLGPCDGAPSASTTSAVSDTSLHLPTKQHSDTPLTEGSSTSNLKSTTTTPTNPESTATTSTNPESTPQSADSATEGPSAAKPALHPEPTTSPNALKRKSSGGEDATIMAIKRLKLLVNEDASPAREPTSDVPGKPGTGEDKVSSALKSSSTNALKRDRASSQLASAVEVEKKVKFN